MTTTHLESPTSRRRPWVEWLLLAASLLVLGGTLAYFQYEDHRQIDQHERGRLASQAKVIDQNLGQQLLAAARVLDAVRDDFQTLNNPQVDRPQQVDRRLRALGDALVGVRKLLVLDASGVAVASNQAQLIGKDFSQRAYFQNARLLGDSARLQISKPFPSAIDNMGISVVVKSRVDARGEFAGIVVATLKPDFLSVLLNSVRYADDMRAAIVHSDGYLSQVSPIEDGVIGADVGQPGGFFDRHRASGQAATQMAGADPVTGMPRFMASRTIKSQDLTLEGTWVAEVSRDEASIFADWRHDAYRLGGLYLLLVMATSAGLCIYQRRQRAYARQSQREEWRRRQAEIALQDSEAYNKLLFAGSHIPLAVLDPVEFCLVDCNQAIVEMYGLGSREAVLASTPEDLAPAVQYDGRNTREAVLDHVQEALRSGLQVFEWRHRRPNGQEWDAEVRLMRFAHGSKTLLQFSLEDITERKRTQHDLRIAATAFESQEAMVITDANLRILRVNRACTEITGYSAEETVGNKPSLFSSGRHDTVFYREMWEEIIRTGSWTGELWNRRKNGEVYPQWANISAVKDDTNRVSHYVSSFTDISHRKTAEDHIRHLAFYDPLTQLPNRRLILDRLRHALLASSRSEHSGALLFIDIDNFKTLNDTLGHDKGDQLLVSIAGRLKTLVREEDTVARLGGDEFVIMVDRLSLNADFAANQAKLIGKKVLDAFIEPHDLGGVSYGCTASIGIALFMRQSDTVEELLKQADLAMYQAKAAGRSTLRFFDPQMQSAALARAALEADLREGLRLGHLLLHYQAQVDDHGRVTGAEALVRWQHAVRGLIPPLEFIPLAEETGLILPLGQWVLEAACTQLAVWSTRPRMANFVIAVNVSAQQLRQANFVDQVLDVLRRTGANPRRLKLELTESLLVDNVEDVIAKMFALKAQGVGFSLDDFGTGYSSLSYLKRLPLDQLKIDQSFVRDIHVDANDAVIAKTIVALAQSLGLSVIAEGVETAAQRDFLAEAGCHAHQGYFFSRPLVIAAFEQYALR